MSVYKDKDRGTWYVSYSYKDYSGGKFKHVTKRGFKTAKEAKEWERNNHVERKFNTDGTFTDICKEFERVSQCGKEMARKHSNHLEERCSMLKDRQIKSITKSDLTVWRDILMKSAYSTSTKNSTITFVKSVFKYAAESYDIPNVALHLKRFKKTDEEIMREMEIWTPEEFERFREVVDVRVYRVFFEFLFWTGCRRGEALALQKADVSDGWATIRYSQGNAIRGLKPTKTKNIRKIQLDDILWQDVQEQMNCSESSYVFTNTKGHPLDPGTVRLMFRRWTKKANLKPIRVHDLRHSHASWLINNGVNIVAVSKRLGHSTVEQTLNVYTHLIGESDQNMMEKLNLSHGTILRQTQ